MASWSVGELIQNRFEVRIIRKGGMGVVYGVWDRRARELYAAKTYFNPTNEVNPVIRQRFEREARNWINLDVHTNIVQAHFVEHVNELPFIFLEYVSGGDLRSRLGAPLRIDAALAYAWAICEGMKHAAANGMAAHCDLKPENCLITQDEVLKVTDFGLAVSWLDQMKTSGVGGTVPYMAPERFRNDLVPSVQLDVYSFGVMLFEMLTGRFPFPAETTESLVHAHCHVQPVPLKPRFGALGGLVDACLEKSPQRRPRDFSVIAKELRVLDGALGGQPRPTEASGAGRHNNKGASLMELGEYEGALACFDRAIAANPGHANAWNNRGNLFMRTGDYDAAIDSYEHALALEPNNALAWSNKALSLKRLGRVEEAVACYGRAVALEPGNPITMCNLGSALLAQGKRREAVACFDQALNLDAKTQIAWFNKGLVLSDDGPFDLALQCLDHALSLNPEDPESWCIRGWTLGRLGRHEEEVAAHRKALALNKELDSAWCGMGIGLAMLGRVPESRQCFERAVSLNPGNTRAAEALRTLRR